jgi:hypothetical protein
MNNHLTGAKQIDVKQNGRAPKYNDLLAFEGRANYHAEGRTFGRYRVASDFLPFY